MLSLKLTSDQVAPSRVHRCPVATANFCALSAETGDVQIALDQTILTLKHASDQVATVNPCVLSAVSVNKQYAQLCLSNAALIIMGGIDPVDSADPYSAGLISLTH